MQAVNVDYFYFGQRLMDFCDVLVMIFFLFVLLIGILNVIARCSALVLTGIYFSNFFFSVGLGYLDGFHFGLDEGQVYNLSANT